MGYTVFLTYLLESTSGYSTAIHCNYIQAIPMDTDNPYIMEIIMNFSTIEDFKFLSNNITNDSGYTAQKIFALIQLISGTTNITPNSADWRKYEVTDQVSGYTVGTSLSAAQLTAQAFKIPLHDYDSFDIYDLSYLSYPTEVDTKLCFGDEIYFLGNVISEIHADVYVTDLSVILNQDEFNTSTNKTWDSSRDTKVSISEIAIYDDSTPKNLVAIGKLNSPIDKNSSIARTILFALDF